MTVATTAAKAGPYTGNNVAPSFAFSFKVFADADVRVVETLIATGVETDLVLNTDYTVTRNADQDNNPGGSITYKVASVTTALPSTKTLTIVGDLEYEQPTDIPNGGAWFASVIENALDRLTLLTKQLKEATDRAVKVPVSSSTNPDDLVASVTASEAAAAASAASAASSAAAAEAAIPSGSLGFTPVNVTGDTMTGELALPSIKLGGGASVTSFGNVVTKTVGAAIGNVPLVGAASDTEAVEGLSRRNTTAEAEAGTLDEGHMTPLKTAQALAALGLAGTGQAVTNVKSSPGRALSTVYTNTTGKPIFLAVVATHPSGGSITLSVDTVTAVRAYASSSSEATITYPIPPGADYEITGAGMTIATWTELR